MTEDSKEDRSKKDIQVFLLCSRFAKCIGVAPSFLPASNKLKKYAHVFYISTLMSIYAIFSTYEVLGRIQIYMKDDSLSYMVIIMDVILDLSMFLSVATSLLFTVTRSHVWEDFLTRFGDLEGDFSKFTSKQSNNLFSSVVRTGLLFLSTITTNLTEYLIHIEESLHIQRCYLDLRIYTFYILFNVVIVSNVAAMIRARYNVLSAVLVDVVSEEVLVPGGARKVIGSVQVVYAKLNRLVGRYNEIVGWQIFYVPVNAILMILQSFNYCFFRNDMRFDMSWKFLATYVGISLNWLILTIVIVMACDRVEKSGKKFTQTCYLLQEGMTKSQLRDELEYLAVFSEKLCPTFSAAGFYKVNQRVLAALFSIVTTYSIISVQFNISK